MQGRTLIINLTSCCLLISLILGSAAIRAQEEVRKHVVKSLDNYYSLSLKYDVSIQELKLANPGLTNPRPGDTLIIPQERIPVEEPVGSDCLRFKKSRNELYRVALMIPLFLEQVSDTIWYKNLDQAKISEIPSFRFIQFYQGFMFAMDSLRQAGLNVEIYVYDVDQLADKVLNVLRKPELKKMDIIFGPFFKSSFSQVAEFAKQNKIPIVNPLSVRNDILQGNAYVFKLLPSVEAQPALLAELVSHEYSDHRIIFYIANKYQNFELINQFKKAIEGNDIGTGQKVNVVDYSSDSIQGFLDHASLYEPNLVIVYSENEVLPAALLSRLSELQKDYQISVIGLPEWDKFGNIESNYLIALNTYIFTSSYTDHQSEAVKGFIRAYRSKYLDEPLNYAISGFDAGYFFLSALLYYGRDFEKCINELRIPLIQNQFNFIQDDDGGYDNINWNILQYNGYSLLKKSSY